MIRLSLRSMLSRKLRTALTLLAVFLGVMMISGTFVLTDQIENGFEGIYDQAYSLVDVVITPKLEFGSAAYGPVGTVPEELIETVRGVDGVAAADGYVYGLGSVVVDGKPVETRGAPTIVYSYLGGYEPNEYGEGSPPDAAGEVGIIKQLADQQKLAVGDVIGLTTEYGTEQVTVAGVFTFADAASVGGATIIHTTLPDAQEWFNASGRVSEIYVKGDEGVSSDELKARVAPLLPDGVTVKTGRETAADTTEAINDGFVGPIRSVLLVFGGVAVLVGAFTIFNTFSITVGQRLREFAMLRTLGASRRQVLASIVGEALAMGVVASLAGLFAGLAAARVLNAFFKAAGADIPTAGLGLEARTIVVALGVGIGITLLAALLPALRAQRVAPIAALREGAVLPPSRFGRYNSQIAGVLGVVGMAVLLWGALGGASTRDRLILMGVGAVVVFIAVAMISKHLVRPLAAVIGWPLQRLSAASGRLARENSVRNTGRTAATAAAMMIGLAVVVFVAVFAQSLRATFIDSFDELVLSEFVLADNRNQEPLPMPAGALDAARAVPGVADVSGIVFQPVRVDGSDEASLYAIAPAAITSLWRFDWLGDGDDGLIGELAGANAIVEEQTALKFGLETGDRFVVLTQQGRRGEYTVKGIYRDPVMLNGITVSETQFGALFEGTQRNPWFALVGAAEGADPAEVQRDLEAALEPFPNQTAYTKQQYVDEVSKAINQFLMIFYALLAMSVIISLFGIVNTLVLAVYERTREIGMLRAIGTSRRQVRRMVRYESVITAVIGAVLGIALGVVFGYVVVVDLAAQGFGFAVPFGQLAVFLVVAALAGVVAAIVPARRAARLNILEAIHYE